MTIITIALVLLVLALWFVTKPQADEVENDSVVVPTVDHLDLEDKTKAELLQIAEDNNLAIPSSWNKAKIKAEIIEQLSI